MGTGTEHLGETSLAEQLPVYHLGPLFVQVHVPMILSPSPSLVYKLDSLGRLPHHMQLVLAKPACSSLVNLSFETDTQKG